MSKPVLYLLNYRLQHRDPAKQNITSLNLRDSTHFIYIVYVCIPNFNVSYFLQMYGLKNRKIPRYMSKNVSANPGGKSSLPNKMRSLSFP